MTNAVGMTDFFVLEAGEYLERLDALAQTADYCRQRAKDLWVGTVAEVGMAIREARGR